MRKQRRYWRTAATALSLKYRDGSLVEVLRRPHGDGGGHGEGSRLDAETVEDMARESVGRGDGEGGGKGSRPDASTQGRSAGGPRPPGPLRAPAPLLPPTGRGLMRRAEKETWVSWLAACGLTGALPTSGFDIVYKPLCVRSQEREDVWDRVAAVVCALDGGGAGEGGLDRMGRGCGARQRAGLYPAGRPPLPPPTVTLTRTAAITSPSFRAPDTSRSGDQPSFPRQQNNGGSHVGTSAAICGEATGGRVEARRPL